MAQFPMSDSRRRILSKYPDYRVDASPAARHITVQVDNQLLAESDDALLVQETGHADVYYIPRGDIQMSLLFQTDHSTYCPFKGYARYWSLTGHPTGKNLVWSYEEPYPEVSSIKDYMSFYPDKVKIVVQ